MASLVTQVGVEVLYRATVPVARVTQAAVEVLHKGAPTGRVTQTGVEVLRSTGNAPVPSAKPQMIVWW